ncbi:MAG TPA: hypothetical protein VH500_01585 [Nitrososphaeraceae archaeon]
MIAALTYCNNLAHLPISVVDKDSGPVGRLDYLGMTIRRIERRSNNN